MISSFTPLKKGLSAVRQRSLPRIAGMLGLLTAFAGSPAHAQCPAPVFSNCPGSVTAYVAPNSCAAALNYSLSATSSSAVAYTYALGGATTGTGVGIGAPFFNRGLTHIVVTATNACGSSTCTINLNVLDSIKPVISDRPNITVNAEPGLCGAKVGYLKPTFTDNCPLCPVPNLTALGFGYLGTFGGHDYYRTPNKGEWKSADSFASNVSAYLVAVNTPAEDSFLAAVIPDSQFAWIGFTDRDTEGVWKWTNGEPVTYTNWCDGQPDDWLGNQDFAALNSKGVFGPDGCWDDAHSPVNPLFGLLTSEYGIIETIGCGSLVRIAGLDSGATFPIGTTTVTYLATDPVGNQSTKSFTVTVVDNQPPVISCPPNKTIACNGNSSIAANGTATATDNCGTPTVTSRDSSTQSPDPTACAHYSYNIYRIWTATDVNGKTSTCTQVITVQDVTAPVAVCKNASVNLNASGQATITPAAINNGSSDVCSPVTLVSVSQSAFNCSNAGQTIPVTLTVRDACNNTATCASNVTVTDNTAPSITCPANATVSCSASTAPTAAGTGIATGTDNCGTPTITSSDVSTRVADVNNCANYNYTITRTWTAKDASNNSTSCTQTITVQDNVPPTAICKNININLSSAGTATITPADVNNGSFDNCSPVTLVSVSPSSFNNSHSGQVVPVTLTVRDVCGNTSTCTSNVTVGDNTPPVISCPSNKTVSCGASTAPTAAGTGIATATDNSGAAPTITSTDVSTKAASPTVCGYYNYTITRTWKATDASNNSSTCTQVITVQDNVAPTANCKNITVTLVNGTATITPAMINNGSTDNCSGIASLTASKTTFTCANIGTNQVVLTVKDLCGNTSTCTSTVTVVGQNCNCSIAVTPCNSTYTGGIPTNIYLGYGPQKATITANPGASGTFTYSWSGPTSKLSSTTAKNPVFTPTAAGTYTFTVTIRSSTGCTSTCSVTFCVKDIRVPDNCYDNDDDDDDHNWSSYNDDDDDDKCYSKFKRDDCDDDDDDNHNSNNKAKVYLCHVPPGNPSNAHTICVSVNAVAAHLGNHSGDRLGKCSQTCGTTARKVQENDPVLTRKVKVYPNPSNGSFFIDLPYIEDKALITVTDIQGRVIQQRTVVDGDGNKLQFNLGNAARGVYLVTVVYGDTKFNTKLVVQ